MGLRVPPTHCLRTPTYKTAPPLAHVDHAVGVLEDALAAGHVLLPEALVVSAVGPHLQPKATAFGTEPVALVPGAALEDVLPIEERVFWATVGLKTAETIRKPKTCVLSFYYLF